MSLVHITTVERAPFLQSPNIDRDQVCALLHNIASGTLNDAQLPAVPEQGVLGQKVLRDQGSPQAAAECGAGDDPALGRAPQPGHVPLQVGVGGAQQRPGDQARGREAQQRTSGKIFHMLTVYHLNNPSRNLCTKLGKNKLFFVQ